MKILKSQLKQLITEELNGLLKEIEDNFDGNTGEPLTDKGKALCAKNPECKEKWLKGEEFGPPGTFDHQTGQPLTKKGLYLCAADQICFDKFLVPTLLKPDPDENSKKYRSQLALLTKAFDARPALDIPDKLKTMYGGQTMAGTLHPDGLVPSDEKIEKAIEKVSQKLKQNPKLVQKKIEQSPKLKKVVKAADADVTQDIDMLATMAAADHVLKKFKNKIEALKVRVKEEPEKAAVLKQAIAKLEKKMMDKEIEIMRQMTTYGTKREKDLEK